jgi:hypothetical protein
MNRLAFFLVLVGAVLLITWAAAPAAPSRPAAVADTAFDQTAPVLLEVNAQVERLRKRLASPPAFPAPERDPFRFGRRPAPAAAPVPVPAPPELVTPPAPELPRLIAVVERPSDGGLLRTAFLGLGEELRSFRPGERVGAFMVRSISVEAVELVDTASGAIYRILLH